MQTKQIIAIALLITIANGFGIVAILDYNDESSETNTADTSVNQFDYPIGTNEDGIDNQHLALERTEQFISESESKTVTVKKESIRRTYELDYNSGEYIVSQHKSDELVAEVYINGTESKTYSRNLLYDEVDSDSYNLTRDEFKKYVVDNIETEHYTTAYDIESLDMNATKVLSDDGDEIVEYKITGYDKVSESDVNENISGILRLHEDGYITYLRISKSYNDTTQNVFQINDVDSTAVEKPDWAEQYNPNASGLVVGSNIDYEQEVGSFSEGEYDVTIDVSDGGNADYFIIKVDGPDEVPERYIAPHVEEYSGNISGDYEYGNFDRINLREDEKAVVSGLEPDSSVQVYGVKGNSSELISVYRVSNTLGTNS